MQTFDARYPIVPFDPDMKTDPPRWLVRDIWQLGKINGVAGFEKSGKSRLMNWILVGMTKGEVFGLQAIPRKILYLCGEEQIQVVNSRIKIYAELQEVPMEKFEVGFVEAAAMRLDLPKERRGLIEQVTNGGYDMLVIDPLRRVHGADENDSKQMSNIYNDIRKWSNRLNLTIVLLHHTPKINEDTDMTRIASWFRGSTDLPAILDTAQYVDRISKNEIKMLRQGRFPPLPPLHIADLGDEKGFGLKL